MGALRLGGKFVGEFSLASHTFYMAEKESETYRIHFNIENTFYIDTYRTHSTEKH